MSDERDRFGDKLHDVEKAREDQWAREQDRKLMEKMRQRQSAELHCPQCNQKLAPHAERGVAMMGCPAGHGAWLDHEALEAVVKRLG
jgi:hypothetical protein